MSLTLKRLRSPANVLDPIEGKHAKKEVRTRAVTVLDENFTLAYGHAAFLQIGLLNHCR